MHIAVHMNNADLAQALQLYVERRLRFVLSRFGGRVGQVTVRIEADGKTDVRCRIATQILPFGSVTAEERAPDLLAAIDRTIRKVGRLFGRELQRSRDARFNRDSVRMAA